MNETQKRREWIKNAAIVFLVILLVLTFFSGTIQNHSLPEVAVQYAQSGTVSTGVRVSGTVTASQSYNVTVSETRTVRAVYVRNGDEVKAGDVLLELEDEDSQELTDARKQLDSLQADYDKAVLGTTSAGTTAEQQAVAAAQAAVNKAISDRDAFKASIGSSDEQKALGAARRTLSSLDAWKAGTGSGYDSDVAAAYFAAYLKVDKTALFQPDPTPASGSSQASGSGSTGSSDPSAAADPTVTNFTYANLKSEYGGYFDSVRATADADVQKAQWKLSTAASAYDDAITTAQQTLATAKAALADKQNSLATTDKLAQVDLKQKKQALADQQAVVAKLEAKYTDSKITAKQGGIVTAVSAVAGQPLQAGSVACTIQLTDTGYVVEVSVTAEQAQRVQVGMPATVSGYYWGEVPTATVSSIRTDPNTKGNRLVTLTLTGSVESGATYKFVLGERNANYDTVVPKSAVHEDNTGTFVLVVTQKNTPLGTRYYATRTDVTVQASDDTQVAVSGDFTGWDYVVTSSSAPIKSGDLVRLAAS